MRLRIACGRCHRFNSDAAITIDEANLLLPRRGAGFSSTAGVGLRGHVFRAYAFRSHCVSPLVPSHAPRPTLRSRRKWAINGVLSGHSVSGVPCWGISCAPHQASMPAPSMRLLRLRLTSRMVPDPQGSRFGANPAHLGCDSRKGNRVWQSGPFLITGRRRQDPTGPMAQTATFLQQVHNAGRPDPYPA